ncbi:MAG: metal ABC transporter permease [Desulfocapsaceae bacterium]|jgi:zinc transport system permease protein|nr:metal ABC transporter permease [Desulfocapsaceae bacterium]
MTEFMAALADPHLPFLRYAFMAGILASISFGIIGTLVVVRRISSIAGAIAHCVLGGIGAGLYLEQVVGIGWASPVQGAIVVALGAAVVLTLIKHFGSQREDTVIGALWAVGMAVGLLFMARTPGYTDPMSYLFGNILLLSKSDVYLVLLLDLLVVSVVGLFYNKLLALCFDEEYAFLRGVPTGWYYFVLLCLTALTVVLLIRVVGVVMVIALLTLPAAIAGNVASGIKQMMFLAVLICMAFITVGLAASYRLDLPSGPVIIVLSGIVYLLVLGILQLFPIRSAQ